MVTAKLRAPDGALAAESLHSASVVCTVKARGFVLAAAPELPTAIEQGVADLVAPNFIGIYAPTGMPKAMVDQIAAANLKLLAERSYQELLISGTFELEPPLSADKYKAYVESEIARWRPIVTAMGIKID